MDPEAREIWQAIQAANTAWQGGDLDAMKRLFHPDVWMADPTGGLWYEGRETMAEGIADFLEATRLRAFEEGEPEIRIFGATAIVSYPFVVRVFQQGRAVDQAGRETLTLTHDGEGWRVVYRMQSAHAHA
jgi:ketosteroid isomerase-like protein